MGKLESEILKFFEGIKCPGEYLLKNKLKNPKAELLGGKEIDLFPYVVIHSGKKIDLDKEKFAKKMEFERKHEIEILALYIKRCKSVEDVLSRLQDDGYEIMHKYSKV